VERARADAVRFVDSYACLLVLLLANFLLLELVDARRWGAFGSTLLSALALVVAISDPDTGHRITRRHAISIAIAVVVSSLLLLTSSDELVGLAYLLPVMLLVTATLPVTITRVLAHRRVTFETILGAICIFVLVGLLFAFAFLAIDAFSGGPFFAQEGPHTQGEYLYFSFVVLTTLGFGDLSPTTGLPQALVVIEALIGQIFLVTLVARLVTLWSHQTGERG
jgi:Ion channel